MAGARRERPIALLQARTPRPSVPNLTDWLLGEQVVLRDAEHDGLVVNWRDGQGQWNAGYPEIAGYYLQFLCRLDRGPALRQRAAENARRVAGWLDDISEAEPPLTRYLRVPGEPEWRNGALFSFDLAMIVRGLALTAERLPGAVPDGLIERYGAWLTAIEAEGRLASHRARQDGEGGALPEKWSTTPDVHHVKAAACLYYWDDPSARRLALATAEHWVGRFTQDGGALFRDLHPFLYFIEGLLVLSAKSGNQRFLEAAAEAFALVLAEVERCGGTAPGHQGGPPESARADVLAQILRAGLVLYAAGRLEPGRWRPLRRTLRAALESHLANGAIVFSHETGHLNVWATIFGWQAFELEGQTAAGLAPAVLAEALI